MVEQGFSGLGLGVEDLWEALSQKYMGTRIGNIRTKYYVSIRIAVFSGVFALAFLRGRGSGATRFTSTTKESSQSQSLKPRPKTRRPKPKLLPEALNLSLK